MTKIAILGYGTVGSGVAEVLTTNKESITKKAGGEEIDIKYILDIRDFEGTGFDHLFTKNFDDILNDNEVEIVVEVMGGVEPAYTFSKSALQKGKSVVTSNKELVATHGDELLQIAIDNKANYLFEASVAGGIPVIRPLTKCLAANDISEITGILNGTTNYILSQMKNEGQSFYDALKDAQNKGYAERNPEADVEGYDACRKIAILCSLVYGTKIDYNNIYTEGITKIYPEDIKNIEKMNCAVKLLATSRLENGKINARVSPAIIQQDNPLSNVEGVFNAVLVKGNASGDIMFYGSGAGKLPTASAVVGDVIDCARHKGKNTGIIWSGVKEGTTGSYLNMEVAYYIRIKTDNTELLKSEIKTVLPNYNIINDENELSILTPFKLEKDLKQTIEEIKKLGSVKEIASVIRKIN